MLTRFLAGYGLREPDFRRHLPPDLQAVAYPSNNDHHFAMPLLAEFDAAIQVPYWTLYTRPTQPSIIP
jgi:hypothetical protein